MWEADERGKLETTPLKLTRMLSASIDEIGAFLNELYDLRFGEIVTSNNSGFPKDFTLSENCNENVTLENRRMYADYKNKENTRLRVKRHRMKRSCNAKSNGDVTLTSSPSSSTTTSKQLKKHEPFRLPTEEEIREATLDKIRDELIPNTCKDLYERDVFPMAHAFANKCLKYKANARAILHTLVRVSIAKPQKPWAYAVKIMSVEDQNFNERDFNKTT